MIVDCFPFFNEFDMLELRLRTLEDVVDRFVLVESPFAHSGEPKPLYFAENRARFARWNDRIDHLVWPGPPSLTDRWANEYAQRDYLATAVAGLAPGDIVFMGDCDEIVEPETMLSNLPEAGEVVAFELRCCFYYANLSRDDPWLGPRAFRAADFPGYGSMSKVRHSVYASRQARGGWHFTWFGGADAVIRKLSVFSHAEFDIPYFADRRRIELALASGWTMDGTVLHWSPPDRDLPAPMLHDPERWAPFLCRPRNDGGLEPEAVLHAHGCLAYVPPDAPRIVVLADDRATWERIGRERFGERFAGAAAELAALPALAPGTCLVVDGLERREPAATLAAAAAGGATVCAYVRNARSLLALGSVLRGAAFRPGAAMGWAEIDAAAGGRFTVTRRDRVLDEDVFIPSHALADGIGLHYGDIAYGTLTRAAALELITQAYLVALQPLPAG